MRSRSRDRDWSRFQVRFRIVVRVLKKGSGARAEAEASHGSPLDLLSPQAFPTRSAHMFVTCSPCGCSFCVLPPSLSLSIYIYIYVYGTVAKCMSLGIKTACSSQPQMCFPVSLPSNEQCGISFEGALRNAIRKIQCHMRVCESCEGSVGPAVLNVFHRHL